MLLVDIILLFCVFSFCMYGLSIYLNKRIDEKYFDITLIAMSIVFSIESILNVKELHDMKVSTPFLISGFNALTLIVLSIATYELIQFFINAKKQGLKQL